MKKKTIITTEKHEVWVIRQPSGDAIEPESVSDEEAEFADSLVARTGQYTETGAKAKKPKNERLLEERGTT